MEFPNALSEEKEADTDDNLAHNSSVAAQKASLFTSTQ